MYFIARYACDSTSRCLIDSYIPLVGAKWTSNSQNEVLIQEARHFLSTLL